MYDYNFVLADNDGDLVGVGDMSFQVEKIICSPGGMFKVE